MITARSYPRGTVGFISGKIGETGSGNPNKSLGRETKFRLKIPPHLSEYMSKTDPNNRDAKVIILCKKVKDVEACVRNVILNKMHVGKSKYFKGAETEKLILNLMVVFERKRCRP